MTRLAYLGMVLLVPLVCTPCLEAGGLEFISSFRQAPLFLVQSLTVSPDGRYFYSAGYDGEIVILSRDEESGALSWVGSRVIVNRSYDGYLAMPPDGRHLYASNNRFIEIWTRRRGSGSLVDRESFELYPPHHVTGFLEGAFIASPDGRHLYGAANEAYDGHEVPGLVVLARSPNGALARASFMPLHLVSNIDPLPWNGVPGILANTIQTSPDGRYVYVAGWRGIGILRRTPSDGSLSRVQILRTEDIPGFNGDYPLMAIAPDGRYLYLVAGLGGEGRLLTFARDSLRGTLRVVQRQRVWDLRSTLSMGIDSGGNLLALGGLTREGVGRVLLYERDAATGVLEAVSARSAASPENQVPGSFGTAILNGGGLVFSPDRERLYIGRLVEDAISVLAVDSGKLEWVEDHDEGRGGVEGLRKAAGLASSPDGRHVYVPGAAGRTAVFELGAEPRSVRFAGVNTIRRFGSESGAMIFAPSGQHAYVLHNEAPLLSLWNRDPENGRLALAETFGGIGMKGWSLTFSPDFRHLYVGGSVSGDKGILVWERDEDGRLELIEFVPTREVRQGSLAAGVHGRFVYAAVRANGVPTLAAFARDERTGRLGSVVLFGGESFSAGRVVPASDGRHLVVSAYRGIALVEHSGQELILKHFYEPDILSHVPRELALSPDNKRLYGVGEGPSGKPLRVYSLDLEASHLELLESVTDGPGSSSDSIHVTPEGVVITASYNDNNVVFFSDSVE